jgi:PhnB protein
MIFSIDRLLNQITSLFKEYTMKLNPYLMFNGNCLEAFKFYEQCLGGTISNPFTYGESPMADQTPPEMQNHIMHLELVVDGMVLMGSDCPPDMFQEPKGFHVCLLFDDIAKAETVFHGLAENGIVQMPIQETFWAHRFGMLVDRFCTPWMVNYLKTP